MTATASTGQYADADTRSLLERCGALAQGIAQAEAQAAAIRDRRLGVWRELLARGVKAADIAAADGTLSKEAVRDAIRKANAREQAATGAAVKRQRAPRPT